VTLRRLDGVRTRVARRLDVLAIRVLLPQTGLRIQLALIPETGGGREKPYKRR
jgi:hypothetical protein